MLRLLLLVCLAHLAVAKNITGRVLLNGNPDLTSSLPSGCQLITEVRYTGLADAPARLLGSSQRSNVQSFPISYQVIYTPDGSRPNHHSLSARIMCTNGQRYFNDYRTSVPIKENDDISLDIRVIRVV